MDCKCCFILRIGVHLVHESTLYYIFLLTIWSTWWKTNKMDLSMLIYCYILFLCFFSIWILTMLPSLTERNCPTNMWVWKAHWNTIWWNGPGYTSYSWACLNCWKNALERMFEMHPLESETTVTFTHGQIHCTRSSNVLFATLLLCLESLDRNTLWWQKIEPVIALEQNMKINWVRRIQTELGIWL